MLMPLSTWKLERQIGILWFQIKNLQRKKVEFNPIVNQNVHQTKIHFLKLEIPNFSREEQTEDILDLLNEVEWTFEFLDLMATSSHGKNPIW